VSAGPDALIARHPSIAALRTAAQRVLPRVVGDFVEGGAEDERTLRANEAAFAGRALLPRPLQGAASRDLSIEIWGRRLALPVLIGPTGLAGMLWPDGEVAAARAAAAAGTVYCLSHGSTCRIEDLPALGAPRWMQVFIYRDRALTARFTERAQAAGYDALVLTIDNQVLGQRERDLRNGFTIPPRLGARGAVDLVRHAGWVWRMRHGRAITFANYLEGRAAGGDISSLGRYIAKMLDPAASWSDVLWLRRLWRGPLLLKGLLHAEDARLALDHGVDGLIVSNHGGRQLDGAIASLDALPAVVAAVGGRIPVLLDGGVRRGAHVVIAKALGAQACLIGRPHLWGLAVAGELGVRTALEIFRREIDRVMALGGWPSFRAIDATALADGTGLNGCVDTGLSPRTGR
jgi:L-lactate dehydrogenase (cytochrome)/(S)-mandelate dehydrogenase